MSSESRFNFTEKAELDKQFSINLPSGTSKEQFKKFLEKDRAIFVVLNKTFVLMDTGSHADLIKNASVSDDDLPIFGEVIRKKSGEVEVFTYITNKEDKTLQSKLEIQIKEFLK